MFLPSFAWSLKLKLKIKNGTERNSRGGGWVQNLKFVNQPKQDSIIPTVGDQG